MNKLLIAVIGFAIVILFYTIFNQIQTQDVIVENEILNQTSFSKLISIGTIETDASKTIPKFQLIADYLSDKLDDEYGGKVVLADGVESMTQMLINQELDLFVDSPLVICEINENSKAKPFLVRWKQNVFEYHTVFFVKSDSTINKIDEKLNGKRIALESYSSTSSYLLPKFYLEQKNLVLSTIPMKNTVNLSLSGSDETSAHWVISDKTDIGAMSNLDFEDLPESMKKELKIIETTLDIPRHVVSHRSEMNSELVDKITNVLLEMDSDPRGIEILKDFENTEKFSKLPEDEFFCENLKTKLDVRDFS